MRTKINLYYYLLLLAPLIGYLSFYLIGFEGWQLLTYLVIPLYLIFLYTRRNKIFFPKFIYFYIAYTIYFFIWRIFNGYIDEKGLLKYIFNNYHVYYILLIIVIYNTNISKKSYSIFIKLSQILLIVALGGVIIQFFSPGMFVRPVGWVVNYDNIFLDQRPSVFSFVSDNDYGITVLALFSLVFSFQLKQKNIKSLIFFSLITGLYALLTNSRYVIVGFLLVILQFSLLKGTLKKYKYFIYLMFIFGTLAYLIIDVFEINLNLWYQERLFAEGSLENTTRYGAYINFLHFFPQKPIFGTGVHLTEEIRRASRAIGSSQIHVGYLSHLVSYGLFGSFLLFSFWFALAKDLYKKAKRTTYYGPFFAFLVFLWFNVTAVDFYFRYPGLIIVFVFSQFYYNQYLTKNLRNNSI